MTSQRPVDGDRNPALHGTGRTTAGQPAAGQTAADPGPGQPSGGPSRRTFIALTAVGTAAGLAVPQGEAIAVRSLPRTDFDPDWLASLRRRGGPTEYSGAALERIGMPVSGATTGQVYLAGDGRAWLWDIFNADSFRYGGDDWQGQHYATPVPLDPVFTTGFALRWEDAGDRHTMRLDAADFADVRFQGRYPVGRVLLRDPRCPFEVRLEAFSPFVPTNAADSSIPATMFEYTLRNTTDRPISAQIAGVAENPVCLDSRHTQPVDLHSSTLELPGVAGLVHTAVAAPPPENPRPDVLLEEWDREDFGPWTATGTAFGSGPVRESEAPDYFVREGDLGVDGTRFVTSHNWRDGGEADDHRGRLVSEPLTLERRYLAARIGGGNTPDAGLRVVVDGEIVARLAGNNSEIMHPKAIDISAWEGRTATIELVDEATGGWGHVNCDRIWLTDVPLDPKPVEDLPDGGTFALAALTPGGRARPSVAAWATASDWFDAADGPAHVDAGSASLAGTVTVPVDLAPGEETTVRFALAWHFPTIGGRFGYIAGSESLRRHYGEVYDDASDVVADLAARAGDLSSTTRDFTATWYDESTLPLWFLERTLIPASTVATGTCLRFHTGRFYGWEGIYCCDGTCTHVWNYAQSIARLFPELERDARERTDFGTSFHPDTGAVDYRGEADRRVAHDGQCGNVLRAYREHQMSADDAFLRRIWPQVKKATQYLIGHDGEPDGVLEGPQYNTLDATWYGEIPWITGLYVAALRAAAEMADDMDDRAFAARCRDLADTGSETLDAVLWNDRFSYYEHLVDPAHPEATSSNKGCHIDQMFGQTYAHQLGLPRVFAPGHSRAALATIVRNNHLADAHAYLEDSDIDGGRVYSTEGEPGTVMCTWPFGGADIAPGEGDPGLVAYFNEVWTGQEYQLAAHLFAEDMTDEALAVTRAVHERYSAEKRNPYNEIECSDHYARAMMAHAVYLAATGYEYHGPRGHLGMAPRLGDPADVAAAFTVAEGWGLYRQSRRGHQQRSEVDLRYGRLRLRSFATRVPGRPGTRPVRAEVDSGGPPRRLAVDEVTTDGDRVVVTLAEEIELAAGETFSVTVR